jgi:hypothetical protein
MDEGISESETSPTSQFAILQIRKQVDRFVVAVWAGSLLTTWWNFGPGKDFERVAVGLLNQCAFNRCVHESVVAFGTCYDPACHIGAYVNIGEMLEDWKGR